MLAIGPLCKQGYGEKLPPMGMAAQHKIDAIGCRFPYVLRIVVQNDDRLCAVDFMDQPFHRFPDIVGGVCPSNQVDLRKLQGFIVQQMNLGLLQKICQPLIRHIGIVVAQHSINPIPGLNISEDPADLCQLGAVCQNVVIHIQNISGYDDQIRHKRIDSIDNLFYMLGADKDPQVDIA